MMKNFWNRALWPILGLGLLAVVGLQARAAVTSGACRSASRVTVAGPAPAPGVASGVAAEGRVVAYPGSEVIVGTDLAGTIVVLNVREKEKVRRGQVLAEMRSDDHRAALEEARARVLEADADIRLAASEVERARSLWEKSVGSRQAVDKAERDLDAAGARRATAKATADRLAAVLAKTRILSPIDGVVIARHADPGETLEAGQKILTVADQQANLNEGSEHNTTNRRKPGAGWLIRRPDVAAHGASGAFDSSCLISYSHSAHGPIRLEQHPGSPAVVLSGAPGDWRGWNVWTGPLPRVVTT